MLGKLTVLLSMGGLCTPEGHIGLYQRLSGQSSDLEKQLTETQIYYNFDSSFCQALYAVPAQG